MLADRSMFSVVQNLNNKRDYSADAGLGPSQSGLIFGNGNNFFGRNIYEPTVC
jgi:hypothetical protein